MITLGTAVRRLRQQAGLTQAQLADRVDVSASYLSRIESDRREPALSTVRRLAQELPVWPGMLLATLVQTEMPEELEPVFDAFVEEIIRSADAAQLALPLREERGGEPEQQMMVS